MPAPLRLHPRKRLDIGWTDLASGLGASLLPPARDTALTRVERLWAPRGDGLACLSCRSALDLFLDALALPDGSEVLVSALTIPDMVRIVEQHGLVPVPVDLDLETLGPDPASLERAVSPRTRAALFAHLFGARADLDPLAELCERRGLALIEDCAQAWEGPGWRGHERADIALFSFGAIKTGTALGGALARVRERALLARMRARQASWPMQPAGAQRRRTLKYAALQLLGNPLAFGLFARGLALVGRDHDRVIHAATRGFAGQELFTAIRRQPAASLLALLARRLERHDAVALEARRLAGEQVIAELGPEIAVPGRRAPRHTHWVLPVVAERPQELVRELCSQGFDAARAASLACVAPPPGRAPAARVARALEGLVYLPAYPEVPRAERSRLAAAVRAIETGAGLLRPRPPPRAGEARAGDARDPALEAARELGRAGLPRP